MPPRVNLKELHEGTMEKRLGYFGKKQILVLEEPRKLLVKFLDFHPNGRDEAKWRDQFPDSTDPLYLLGDFLAEFCWWAFSEDARPVISIYSKLVMQVRIQAQASEHGLCFAKAAIGGYVLGDFQTLSKHFSQTSDKIKRCAGGEAAGKWRPRVMLEPDVDCLVLNMHPDAHRLRMAALMYVGLEAKVEPQYWIDTDFDDCEKLENGEWYIPFALKRRLAMPMPLCLKHSTKAHIAFSDWHSFRSNTDYAVKSIFGLRNVREVTEFLRAASTQSRFPSAGYSFCSFSLFWGALATSYANDVFSDKSLLEATNNLKSRVAREVDESRFKFVMNGLHDRLLNYKRECDDKGKKARIDELPLSLLHRDLTKDFKWRNYSDMPTPNRQIGRSGRLRNPASYNAQLNAILDAIRKTSKVGGRASLDWCTAKEEKIAYHCCCYPFPRDSFHEAFRILIEESGETERSAKQLVISAMIQCRFLTVYNWKSCVVPVEWLHYFRLQPGYRDKNRAEVTQPYQRTHEADKSTNPKFLKRHVEKSRKKNRKNRNGLNSLPRLQRESILNYPGHDDS